MVTGEERQRIRRARDLAGRQRARDSGRLRVCNEPAFAERCFDAADGDPLAALARALDILHDQRVAGRPAG